MFLNKYGGANGGVKNITSHLSMSVPTNADVNFLNGKTVDAQGIGIILCCFPNRSIIYSLGLIYCFLGHPYNTILPVDLKWCVGFQKVTFNLLKNLFCLSSRSFLEVTHLDYLQVLIVKFNPQINWDNMVTTIFGLSKYNISQLIHQLFGHIPMIRVKILAREVTTKGPSTNIPGL